MSLVLAVLSSDNSYMNYTGKACLLSCLALILVACSSEDKYEHPEYVVLEQEGDVEVRAYEPMLLAEVEVDETDRGDAGSTAFRILFDYISGANMGDNEIAMTVPVTQVPKGQEIAMTVPVTQTGDAKSWRTSFRLPSSFSVKTAPKPTDGRIRIYETPKEKVAAIRFSGFWGDENVEEHKQKLEAYIKAKGLTYAGGMRVAFYNDPFTLPWERRNEVLYPIQ